MMVSLALLFALCFASFHELPQQLLMSAVIDPFASIAVAKQDESNDRSGKDQVEENDTKYQDSNQTVNAPQSSEPVETTEIKSASVERKADQNESFNDHNGFLPTRGSFMLDLVFLSMLLILPVMQFSILQVQQKRYRLHRNIQIGSAIVLLIAVVFFEIDMRYFTNWRQLAEPSALYRWCTWLLYLHLCFAVPTPFLWGWVIYGALRNLNASFQGPYVAQHRLAGKAAAVMMYGTGLTGILFYVVAFVL